MTIGTRRGFETLRLTALCLTLLATGPAGAAPDPAAQCEASKLKAAGKRANCLTVQQSKTLLGRAGDPTKCDASFAKGFQKAEDKGGSACPTTGDADTVGDLVDAGVGGVAAALAGSAPPPPPACPTFPGTGQTTAFTADRNDGVDLLRRRRDLRLRRRIPLRPRADRREGLPQLRPGGARGALSPFLSSAAAA
jgi:hypothetical protein